MQKERKIRFLIIEIKNINAESRMRC